MTQKTIELSLWALKKYYVQLAHQPKLTPGIDEADLRMLAMSGLLEAIHELNTHLTQTEDPQ